MSATHPQVDPLVYTIPEAAKLLRVSTRTMYDVVRQKDFPAVRISPNRMVVPKAGLEAWLTKKMKGGDHHAAEL